MIILFLIMHLDKTLVRLNHGTAFASEQRGQEVGGHHPCTSAEEH